MSHHDTGRELARRDRVEEAQGRSLDRSRTLLLASQAFTRTENVDDVLAHIPDLVRTELAPDYVGAVVVDDSGRTRRLDDDPVRLSPTHSAALDPLLPSALAIRDATIVHHPDRDSVAAQHPAEASAILRHLGLHSVGATVGDLAPDAADDVIVFAIRF